MFDLMDMAMITAAESIPGIDGKKCQVINYRKLKFPQEINIKIIISTFENENKTKHLCESSSLVDIINQYLQDENFNGRISSIGYNIIENN